MLVRIVMQNYIKKNIKEALIKVSEENYELNEKVKIFENRIINSIKLVD